MTGQGQKCHNPKTLKRVKRPKGHRRVKGSIGHTRVGPTGHQVYRVSTRSKSEADAVDVRTTSESRKCQFHLRQC